jgi:hypothetical protein
MTERAGFWMCVALALLWLVMNCYFATRNYTEQYLDLDSRISFLEAGE